MIAVMFVLKRIKPSSIVPTKLLPLFFFTYYALMDTIFTWYLVGEIENRNKKFVFRCLDTQNL